MFRVADRSSLLVKAFVLLTLIASCHARTPSKENPFDPDSGLGIYLNILGLLPYNFSYTGTMKQARTGHTATLLNDGRVLITGGYLTGSTTTVANTAELYDPVTGTFSSAGNMSSARVEHSATLLPNNTVLIAGGTSSGFSNSGLATAETFDPTTNAFTATAGNMPGAFRAHAAVYFKSGATDFVLLAGGAAGTGSESNAAYVYNVGTRTFANASGTMLTARMYAGGALISDSDDKVLVAGGRRSGNPEPTAEIYDHGVGFSATGTMTAAREGSDVLRLPDGRIAMVGNDVSSTTGNHTEFYNPSTGTFTAAEIISPFRYSDAGEVLSNGKILVSGGLQLINVLTAVYYPEAYLIDPTSGKFSLTGRMNTTRVAHKLTRLANKKVLVTGGVASSSSTSRIGAAELYTGPGTE